MKVKTCRECGEEFPSTTKYFYRQGKSLTPICKTCWQKRSARNREKKKINHDKEIDRLIAGMSVKTGTNSEPLLLTVNHEADNFFFTLSTYRNQLHRLSDSDVSSEIFEKLSKIQLLITKIKKQYKGEKK